MSEFFSVSSNDKKKNINVWISYNVSPTGVNTCINYKKTYIHHSVDGNGDFYNIIDALLDSTSMAMRWFENKKDTVSLTIYCKNNHYYNIMNEWRHAWKKNNYKIKDTNRPFSEKLVNIDEIGVEISKVVHVVNQQEWNTKADKQL